MGREIALQLAKRGCNIVIVDVDLKSAENTCADLREKGVKAYCYRVDVSSFEQVKSLATTVYQDIGPVDILVNNAGLIHFTFLQDSTEQDVNRLIDVNVKSYIWVSKIFGFFSQEQLVCSNNHLIENTEAFTFTQTNFNKPLLPQVVIAKVNCMV